MSVDKWWGKPQNGLCIHVDISATNDKRHNVILYFQNVSNATVRVWQSGFWPNTKFECLDSNGVRAELTAEGKKWQDGFSPGGMRSYNIPVDLNPGQIYVSTPVALEMLYNLQLHEVYQIKVIYSERLDTGWAGAITSNVASMRD